MRTIEQEMLGAVENKQSWHKSNTRVIVRDNIAEVWLFNNHIGNYEYTTKQFITNIRTLLNWPSATTFSRLRALGVNVNQKNWRVYIDSQPIGDKLKYDYSDGVYK